jgi:chaperonin GroEL (HSP60 family)
MQVVAAGANPIQITRGIDKTVAALVKELKLLSKEVRWLLWIMSLLVASCGTFSIVEKDELFC